MNPDVVSGGKWVGVGVGVLYGNCGWWSSNGTWKIVEK